MAIIKDAFYLFAPPPLANPSSYSCMESEGRKIVGRKMKSTSNLQLLWDATWNNTVKYCTHGITNATAERITSKIISIKRIAGVLSRDR